MSEITKATNINAARALRHISSMKVKGIPKGGSADRIKALTDFDTLTGLQSATSAHQTRHEMHRLSQAVASSYQKKSIKKRDFSDKRRSKLASKGDALSDGSFPIPDKDALRRARMSIGRSKDPAAARALIDRRAKELGVSMKGSDINKSAFGVEHEGISKANNRRAQQVENVGTTAAVGGPLAGAGLAFHSGKHINQMKTHNAEAARLTSNGFERLGALEHMDGIAQGAKASKELSRAGALGAAGIGLGIGAKAVALRMKKKNGKS